MEEKNEGTIQIGLSEEVAEGIYTNLAVVGHSSSEFVFDFIRLLPGMKKAEVKSRIVMAPEHAKRLLLALNENVGKYEAVFGQILVPDSSKSAFPFTTKGDA